MADPDLSLTFALETVSLVHGARHKERQATDEAEKELTTIVNAMAGKGMDVIDVRNFHDCDVAFHRRIWELAGNEYLRDTLEAITFRLFVFSVVDRWPGNPKPLSERLAAVQEHLGILEELRTRDKNLARQAFMKQTVQYWNM